MFSSAAGFTIPCRYPPCAPVAAAALLCEPPGRYRRRRRRHYDAHGAQAITRRAERRVAAHAPKQVETLLALADQFRKQLDAETLAQWLELEEALHAYWLQVAIEHYELGADTGLRRAAGTLLAALPPRARLEAIARALHALGRDLPE